MKLDSLDIEIIRKFKKNKNMKKVILTTLIILAAKFISLAAGPDDVVGVWLVGDKDYKIELYKTANGEIEGKVVWMKEPNDKKGKPRTDVDNPDPKLQSRPVMGLKTVIGFKYDKQENEFVDGKVYKKGKTYCGKMKLNTDGTLYLRGYICSASIFGKSDTWTRVK